MSKTLKRNSVIVFGLAALFWWAFMFLKHNPALRSVIPFGEDPYDAVGSFGVIAGMLIALVSLVRAFRPYSKEPPSTAQRVYLLRSQEAVVLAVLITLTADGVAMARHPSMWVGAASRYEMLALVGALAVAAIAVHLLIRTSQHRLMETGPVAWKGTAVASFLAVLTLALYPEQLISRTSTHLLTVVMGDVVLFALMRPLLTVLVPFQRPNQTDDRQPEAKHVRGRLASSSFRWGVVLIVGVLVGAFAFLGEMSEGVGGQPVGRLVLVASVFVGLGLAGLLVAYAFLGEPLGLGPRG